MPPIPAAVNVYGSRMSLRNMQKYRIWVATTMAALGALPLLLATQCDIKVRNAFETILRKTRETTTATQNRAHPPGVRSRAPACQNAQVEFGDEPRLFSLPAGRQPYGLGDRVPGGFP